jgi:hypothetical protein
MIGWVVQGGSQVSGFQAIRQPGCNLLAADGRVDHWRYDDGEMMISRLFAFSDIETL